MHLEEIQVDIDALGHVQLRLHGFTGTRCLDATAALEAQLGVVEDREMRPEALDCDQEITLRRHVGGEGPTAGCGAW